MEKFLRVMIYEYTRHVRRGRFLFSLLSLPILAGCLALILFLLVKPSFSTLPVGYVDFSHFLSNPIFPNSLTHQSKIEIIPFSTIEDAQSALEDRKIQAYYILDASYLETFSIKRVSHKSVSFLAQEQFDDFLRINLLADRDPDIVNRVLVGSHLNARSIAGSDNTKNVNMASILVPLIFAFAFVIMIFTTSGYLMQAVVEEKQNRTIEVLVSSISPNLLLGGKILGILAIGLTQMVVWISLGGIAFLVASKYIEGLSQITLPYRTLGVAALIFTLTYIMVSAIMLLIGSSITEPREGQQTAALVVLPVYLPIMLMFAITTNPNTPLAIGLSIFPLTAPLTLTMRMAVSHLPVWQVLLHLGIMGASALGCMLLAGRAFHRGLLRFNHRLSLRDIIKRENFQGDLG